MPDASATPMPDREAQLEAAIASPVPSDFAASFAAAALSIPLGRAVPRQHRFAPLLVLGALGSVADHFRAQDRLRVAQAELDALRAARTGQPPAATPPS